MKEVVYFFLAVLTVAFIAVVLPFAIVIGAMVGIVASAGWIPGVIIVVGPPFLVMATIWYFVLRWGRGQDRLRAIRKASSDQ